MSVDYIIRADIVFGGGTGGPGIPAANKQLGLLESRASGLGSMLASALAGLGVGAALRGLIGMNSELENAQSGMASLFSAFNGTSFDTSLVRAKALISGLRTDAAMGAGEMQTYVDTFQQLLGATGGQIGDDGLRVLTRNATTAGFAMRGNPGMELMRVDLLQALSSGIEQKQTPLIATAMRTINMGAAEFNKLDMASKVVALNKGLANFEPGAKAMARGWDAQMSTLKDGIKSILIDVSHPLFERWSEQLIDVNDWLTSNKEQISDIATHWGVQLVGVWDTMIERAHVLGPLITAMGAAKIGAGLMPMISGVGGALGIGGGAGAAGGAATGVLGALGAALTPLVVPVLAVTGVTIALTAAAYGAYKALDKWPYLLTDVQAALSVVATDFSRLASLLMRLDGLSGSLDTLGWAVWKVALFSVYALDAMVKFGIGFTYIMEIFTSEFSSWWRLLGHLAAGNLGKADAEISSQNAHVKALVLGGLRDTGLMAPGEKRWDEFGPLWQEQGPNLPPATPPPATPPDNYFNGPITINAKTEINEDPARVAMAIEEVLTHLDRYRRQPKRLIRPI